MQKTIRDINKYLQSTESGPWSQSRVSALDRALGELNRIFDKKVWKLTLCGFMSLVPKGYRAF